MNRTSREQFLWAVRRALGRSSPPAKPPAPPPIDESLVRLADPSQDLLPMFTQRANQTGMSVRWVARAGLATQLLDVIREVGAKTATVAMSRLPDAPELRRAIESAGIEIRSWERDPSMASHYTVDVGITDVHAAIAETGTLVCSSDAWHGRGLSLVPPIHIAIVRRSDIVPDLLDYLRSVSGLAPGELPSAQALISGPSKTGDIEGILVTGVHGPGRVCVLVVDDP